MAVVPVVVRSIAKRKEKKERELRAHFVVVGVLVGVVSSSHSGPLFLHRHLAP